MSHDHAVEPRCLFCGRTPAESGNKVVTSKHGGAICEGCVKDCASMFAEDEAPSPSR